MICTIKYCVRSALEKICILSTVTLVENVTLAAEQNKVHTYRYLYCTIKYCEPNILRISITTIGANAITSTVEHSIHSIILHTIRSKTIAFGTVFTCTSFIPLGTKKILMYVRTSSLSALYSYSFSVTLGCGGTSAENNSYIVQSSTTTSPANDPSTSCTYQICPCSKDVCRIRYDFTQNVLATQVQGSTSATDNSVSAADSKNDGLSLF